MYILYYKLKVIKNLKIENKKYFIEQIGKLPTIPKRDQLKMYPQSVKILSSFLIKMQNCLSFTLPKKSIIENICIFLRNDLF